MEPGSVAQLTHPTLGTVPALVLHARQDDDGATRLNLVFVSPNPADAGGLGRTTGVAQDVAPKLPSGPQPGVFWTLPDGTVPNDALPNTLRDS